MFKDICLESLILSQRGYTYNASHNYIPMTLRYVNSQLLEEFNFDLQIFKSTKQSMSRQKYVAVSQFTDILNELLFVK
jgi:hypothetical protein